MQKAAEPLDTSRQDVSRFTKAALFQPAVKTDAGVRIYHSSNGDIWDLAKGESGRLIILHTPNKASRGSPSSTDLTTFLSSGSGGPQSEALLDLISSLIETHTYLGKTPEIPGLEDLLNGWFCDSSSLDQVTLKDLSLFAYHGLFSAEAELGQRFYIDVSIGADLSYAERADEADGTVNWAELVEVVTKAFTMQRFKLIEAAAAAIANAILDHFQLAQTVRVEVRKPSAPNIRVFKCNCRTAAPNGLEGRRVKEPRRRRRLN